MASDCLLQINSASGQAWMYVCPDWNYQNRGWFIIGSSGGFQPIAGLTQGTVYQLPTLMQLVAQFGPTWAGPIVGILGPFNVENAQVGDGGGLEGISSLPYSWNDYNFTVIGINILHSSDTHHSLIARLRMRYKLKG